MTILNWISFIIVCLDTVGYIIDKARDERCKGFVCLIGLLVGIALRVYVLYNAATYWLLT